MPSTDSDPAPPRRLADFARTNLRIWGYYVFGVSNHSNFEGRITVDPQPLTAQQIADQYFQSINGHRQQHHTVMRNMSIQESKSAEEGEIQADASTWYAGFASHHEVAKGQAPLPTFDAVFPLIHRHFATRVKYSPPKV